MNLPERYQEALRNFPAPGGGGAHPYELKIANLGFIAGLSADQIFQDIRHAIPTGTRRISDREITDAINKALQDHNGGTYTPRPRTKPIVHDGAKARQGITDQGKYSTEQELLDSSPVSIPTDPTEQQRLFLRTRFQWNDFIFIGDRTQPGIPATFKPCCQWTDEGAPGPFVIVNPLSGYPAPLKSGNGVTYRGDGNISFYRHAMAEFDALSCEDQIRFWSAIQLPIIALIHSGGKSLHCWIDVRQWSKVETPEQWQSEIKTKLYDQLLTPYGIDQACSNAARLSRLPGHFRTEKKAYQRLLWLSPEGRPI